MARATNQTAHERALQASLAAHTAHSRHSPKHMTAKARAAFNERFEHEADPDKVLPPAERERRATHLRKAHMRRLSLQAAKARRLRSAGGEQS